MHSYFGYESLLENAGFSETTYYIPLLDHRHPKIFYNSDRGSVSEALSTLGLPFPWDLARSALQLLERVNAAELFVPSYIVRAQK